MKNGIVLITLLSCLNVFAQDCETFINYHNALLEFGITGFSSPEIISIMNLVQTI